MVEPEKFAREYVANLPVAYYPRLLRHYMREIAESFQSTGELQSSLLRDQAEVEEKKGDDLAEFLNQEIMLQQETLYPPNDSIDKAGLTVENPVLTTMRALEDLLLKEVPIAITRCKEMEQATKKFLELTPTMRNVVFYRTWVSKGRPTGIAFVAASWI